MTFEVPLTRGLAAIVDDSDRGLVGGLKWQAMPGGRTFYARRSFWVPAEKRTRGQSLHTLLTGWPCVDHINGNGLDNRRANLREASTQQNRRNSQSAAGSSSQFKGVVRHADGNWVARIGDRPGHQLYLGYFTSEVAAARAYDVAALELFGEFARLNLSTKDES